MLTFDESIRDMDAGELRVGILCSDRAPGLDAILANPLRGVAWDVACVISSEPLLASRESIEDAGVPVFHHPVRRFHEECGAPLRDAEARRSYDALTLHVFQQLDVNVVLMLGYLYVATDVLLAPFAGRVFNIHDSDLTIRRADGERKYAGLHSTRDAVAAGEPETRSTLHVVTSKLDGGPIVLQSRAYPVARFACQAARAGHSDIVNAYAYAQREWMMRDSWGDMAIRALDALSMSEARRGDFLEAGVERTAVSQLDTLVFS